MGKKGHSSLNGVVSATCNGKCIDFHVVTKHCKQYSIWESRKNNPDYDYEQWKIMQKEGGKCEINHLVLWSQLVL